MWYGRRREFLRTAAGAVAGAGLGLKAPSVLAQVPGERPRQDDSVEVLNPAMRVPVSFIIDDSTCLVNLNKFAVPQFAAAWDYERYRRQKWRQWPDSIPDDFVRRFASWCAEHGVKGKYSIVPYPACVGRVDRLLPGWSSRELAASLDLVRETMLPDWDIHPEMVTHTRAVDVRTGHPYPQISPQWQENWRWSDGKSVDELAEYVAYALRILKNVDLPCEGVTTPGGFAGRVVPQFAQAVRQAVGDVMGAEIPHYFKFLHAEGDQSVAPQVQYASNLETEHPKCVVSVLACTGDWTGGWDCSDRGDVDKFITADLNSGRMVEVIDRGEPAIMLSHWTGIYFNGEEVGFRVFQEAVRRLHRRYDHLRWMKLSEIARYWAARELTRIEARGDRIELRAPFASPEFTLRVSSKGKQPPRLTIDGKRIRLNEVRRQLDLKSGTWFRDKPDSVVVCFDLPKGTSTLQA